MRLRSILLLFILSIGFATYATDYTPLVREGVKWVYLYSDVTASGDYLSYSGKGDYAYYMEFKGDTVINDMTYKKLYASLSRAFDTGKLRPVAYLREVDKHVYGISDPIGRYQYAESHNLELPLRSMAVYGDDAPWREYELYDFNDLEAFTRKALYLTGVDGVKVNVIEKNVDVGGEDRNAYEIQLIHAGVVSDSFTIVEGIGNEYENLLSFGPSVWPRCVCPIPLGLAQQETSGGDVLYHGAFYYGPYQGNELIDIDDVNQAINIILGKGIYSRHYLNDISDFNADYAIDIDDVNAIINYILTR